MKNAHRVSLLARLLILLTTAVSPSVAETFVVNTFEDINTGSCSDSECSLREAVLRANLIDGQDTIELPPGTYTLTIAGAGEDGAVAGDLDIADSNVLGTDLYITGGIADEVAILDASGLGDRVFHLLPGAEASIHGVAITGGSASWHGGGIYNEGDLRLSNSAVEDNASAYWSGGGIYNAWDAWISDCTISDNASAELGGGIFNDVSGHLSLEFSTVSGNSATHGGGLENKGELYVLQSTISGNSAWNGGGGVGISNPAAPFGYTTLSWVTMTDNWSLYQGDAIDSVGFFAHPAKLGTSIIHGECWAITNSLGGNMESPGDTCSLDQATDQPNVPDPMMAPLAGNGGPTPTHALLPGSPARNSVLCGGASMDQRHAPRPTILGCDKGAYEAGQVPPGTWIFEDGFESGTTLAWSSAVP